LEDYGILKPPPGNVMYQVFVGGGGGGGGISVVVGGGKITTVVVTVLRLLSGLLSGVSEVTVEVFVRVVAKLGALTVTVMDADVPAARELRVAVKTPLTRPIVQPEPLALTNVSPAGKASVTTTFWAGSTP